MINRVINKLKSGGIKGLSVAIANYPSHIFSRKAYKKMLTLNTLEERFAEIYDKNLWSSKESLSGEGSEVAYTESLRGWLIDNIPRLNIKEFVDAPCGDFNWMKLVTAEVDINYIGLDIAESVIKRNKSEYTASNLDFRVANICKDEIPDCDLLMVRDCLFHLSYKDIDKFLKNLSNTNYKYLLTTTHLNENGRKNTDIISGDYRDIYLFCEPFNFNPKCISDRVLDYPKDHAIPREMILIEKKFVPTSLSVIHDKRS